MKSFFADLLPILRCPHCRNGFNFTPVPRPALGRGEFGTLKCGCFVYPFLDDIPILLKTPVGMFEHTRGNAQSEEVSISRLVNLVETGRAAQALLECLTASGEPNRVVSSLLGWRRSREVTRWFARRRFASHVLVPRDRIGACDVLDYYYLRGGPLDPEMGHYFIRRFGMPRHLAALSLAARIPIDPKPILDIACGIGHLEHYFTNRADATPVVGLDINFYHLWIAKHWMAPLGRYVCATASDSLPFADGAFSSTLCSDAYHLISNRPAMLEEIRRCAGDGVVIVTRAGNRDVMPNEGQEQAIDGYLDELGDRLVRVFDEQELVRLYLRNLDPFSSAAKAREEISESKWLSFAWNVPTTPLRTIASDTVAPHAVGKLGINPIYLQASGPNGEVQLRFQFPLAWYAYENHAMLSYHPRRAALSRTQLDNLSIWQGDPSMQELVDAFVLLGLPSRFSGDRLRS